MGWRWRSRLPPFRNVPLSSKLVQPDNYSPLIRKLNDLCSLIESGASSTSSQWVKCSVMIHTSPKTSGRTRIGNDPTRVINPQRTHHNGQELSVASPKRDKERVVELEVKMVVSRIAKLNWSKRQKIWYATTQGSTGTRTRDHLQTCFRRRVVASPKEVSYH